MRQTPKYSWLSDSFSVVHLSDLDGTKTRVNRQHAIASPNHPIRARSAGRGYNFQSRSISINIPANRSG